ncbi:helix-turn-helix domain-containing protein [Zavarzinia sp. CC-PAN008]|uniref:helix-turn-helix domain-containing protein n=1 Tax=Zavarzinia sp. CC-PAN008 TaxID=3243332 RepID=UPI003F746B80
MNLLTTIQFANGTECDGNRLRVGTRLHLNLAQTRVLHAIMADPCLTEDQADPAILVTDSLDLLQGLGNDGPRLILLAADSQSAARGWTAGAAAVLQADAGSDEIRAAIRAVALGLMVSGFAPPPHRAERQDDDVLVEPLTPREREVASLLAQGLSNKHIARRLGVSDHTVKFHVSAIFSKLGAHTRTEAVARASRLGLVLI